MDENDNEFKRLYKRSQIYIVPQILESQAKFLKEESKTNEDGEKDDEDKRLAPCGEVDFQKLRNCQDRWRGENAEYQVLTKMFYLLQKETTGTSSPGFIFHNKKFEKNRTKQEADIIVVHVALGICILEVKAMEKFKPDYVTKALKQLMDLRECLSDEMENLVQKSFISIHLALPNFPSVEKQRQLLYSHLKILDPESETVLLLDDYELWWTSHADRDRPRLQEETVQQIVTKWCPVPKTTKEVLQMISGRHRQWFITSERAAELALTSAQREARYLHVHGPHGAGKTMLLVQRASSWLSRGCSVVVALGVDWHDLLLAELGHLVTRGQGAGVRNRLRLCRFDKEFLRALKELEGTRLNQDNPRSSRTFPKEIAEEYPVRRRKMRGPRSSCKSHRAESLTVATATGEAGPRPDQCHVQWWACRRVAEAMKSGVNFPGMQTREESAGTGLENTEEGPSWKRAKEETGGGLEEGKSKGDNATMTENRQEEKRTAVTKGEKKKEEKQEAEHKGMYVVIDELSRNDLALGLLTSVCKAMKVGTVKGIWTAHTSSLSSRAKEIVHRYGLEFEEVELEHSYRCPENVVDVLNAISEQDDSLWDPMEESCQVLKMADPVCTMVKPSKIPMPRCPSLRPSFILHPEHKAFRCGLPFKKCPECLLGLQSVARLRKGSERERIKNPKLFNCL